MAIEGEKLRGLRDFFTDAFTASELKMFLNVNGYREVADASNPSVGGIEYFFDVAQALQRRGLIDDEFFERLKQERIKKGARISVLQQLWVAEDQAVPKASGSTTSSGPRQMTDGGPPASPHRTSVAPIGGMMETAGPRRTGVFLSYSHADAAWLERPKVFFETLRLRGIARGWTDHQIKPGDDWSAEIQQALDDAAAAVLLISEDFLASAFIGRVELPEILKARAERGLVILPVYLSASTVADYPDLARIQALNSPQRLLCDMSKGEQDALWVKMSQAIQRGIGPVPAAPAPASPRDDRPAIYLAPAATASLSEFRDEVKDYLSLQLPGVRVLPESSDPGGGIAVAAFVSAVQADLQRSALFVQLLDLSRGLDWFDDAPEEGSVGLLHRCALDLKAPREILQWRDALGPLPKAADSPHRRLLEGPTVSTAGREEFKRMIVERYGELTAPAARAPEPELGEGDEKQIFIDAEPTPAWRSVADRISRELTQGRRIACMMLGEGLETRERRETRDFCLTHCDGLLFVGGSNPRWLMEEREAYLKLKLKRKEAGKSASVPMALCEGPPKPGPCEGPLVPCFWRDPEARRGASVAVRHRLPGFDVIDRSTGVCSDAAGCRGGPCAEAFEQFVRRVRGGETGAAPQSPGGLKP
jgi:hypothetical protein